MERFASFIVLITLSGACARGAAPVSPAPSSATAAPVVAASPAKPFDPRRGGLEVGLAEWTVTLEAAPIRPGRVTFVIHNGGIRTHGFEIEEEGRDSSGHGSGGGLKAETALLAPGESTRLTLDLPEGLYKVECSVPGHDDLGMEAVLEVRAGAPLVTPAAQAVDAVAIKGVKFQPAELAVSVGTEVTWTNQDPTAHTVTADDGGFDSGVIDEGQTFSWTFETSGSASYKCAIHPDMRGTITVG
ncbi:MAG: cupredoxin domain-containing protein [Actinobacteria bacterium]|nr:cupredoxin domain-containing protein [Actinomycetota bacterium]